MKRNLFGSNRSTHQLQTQEKVLNFQEELVYSEHLKVKYAFNNYAPVFHKHAILYKLSTTKNHHQFNLKVHLYGNQEISWN